MIPTFLCDEFITTYFDILSVNIIGLAGQVHLVNPGITHAMKLSHDFKIYLDPHKLHDSNILVFPINDSNEALLKESGMHWSLLAYSKMENKFYYYDSIKTKPNLTSAKIIARKLLSYFSITSTPVITFIEGPTQDNSYDCGIFTLIAAECIILHVKDQVSIASLVIPAVSSMGCIKKRSFLAYVVENGYSTPKDILLNLMVKPSKILSDRKGPIKNNDNNLSDLHKAYKNSNRKRTDHNIILVSDSHGRGVPVLLNNSLPSNVGVSGTIKPSASFSQVCSNLNPESYSKSDFVVIMGGSNDLGFNRTNQLLNSVESVVSSLVTTNVVICTLPYRYDRNIEDSIHHETIFINNHIMELASRNSHVSCLDLYGFKRSLHSKQGQHFNKHGKREIMKCIVNLMEADITHNSQASPYLKTNHTTVNNPATDQVLNAISPPSDQSASDESGNTSLVSSPWRGWPSPIIKSKVSQQCLVASTPFLSNSNFESLSQRIIIHEESMERIINNLKNNDNVAFAHCISKDFEVDRQASAGVAAVFSSSFGKPQRSDLINEYLTLQTISNKTSVYSLLTKCNYFDKPNLADYNLAFQHLIKHLKDNNFKHLICPPMGCVRDLVPINCFAENIVKLQQTTGAYVIIVTYNEHSKRKLRNGLSHQEFVEQLQASIVIAMKNATEYHEQLSQDVPSPSQPGTSRRSTNLQSLDEYPTLPSSPVNDKVYSEKQSIGVCSQQDSVNNPITSSGTKDANSLTLTSPSLDQKNMSQPKIVKPT